MGHDLDPESILQRKHWLRYQVQDSKASWDMWRGHSHRGICDCRSFLDICYFLLCFSSLPSVTHFLFLAEISPFFVVVKIFHLVNKIQDKRMRIKGFPTHCFLISETSADEMITCSRNLALEVSLMRTSERLEWDLSQSSSSCSRGRKTK